MNKEYKFYKYKNNPYGSNYCFCQRPCESNMSLRCFLENGEILGFMSESLVFEHPEIKEIDMNEFMYYFVRPIIKDNYNLQQKIDKLEDGLDKILKLNKYMINCSSEKIKNKFLIKQWKTIYETLGQQPPGLTYCKKEEENNND